jgi:hypothetical protein
MTTEHRQASDGNPVSLRRLLIGTVALPAAIAGLMMAFIPEASATSIEYAFSPGATLTFADGNIESLTGTFTVNMAGPTLTQANITLASAAPEAGVYNTPGFIHPNLLLFFASNLAGTVALGFSSPLGFTPDMITGSDFHTGNTTTLVTHASGYADPIPEPTTLSLLAAALGLFGFRRRASRRDRSACSDQPRATKACPETVGPPCHAIAAFGCRGLQEP